MTSAHKLPQFDVEVEDSGGTFGTNTKPCTQTRFARHAKLGNFLTLVFLTLVLRFLYIPSDLGNANGNAKGDANQLAPIRQRRMAPLPNRSEVKIAG